MTITWLFDRKNKYGYLPNLIKDETLKPNSQEWWDLCTNKPYACEFRFLRYCMLDRIPQIASLVGDIWTGPAYYPINLNYYDPEIDYLSLMDSNSLAKLKEGRFKVLFYYSEGDDPLLGILDSLHSICSHHGVSIDNIKFTTANGLIGDEHPFVYFPDDELYYRYLHSFSHEYVTKVNLGNRDNLFTCLNRADKIWRRVFCSTMDSLRAASSHNNHKLINKDFYSNAYWNIVVETHFKQQTVFLTEKTFKPILNMQPFIIVGNTGSLKMLKQLGYQTFSDIIDERYDDITNDIDRMRELITVCFSIANRTNKEHINMQAMIKETLEYNQQHFIKPKTQRINNYLKKLEY